MMHIERRKGKDVPVIEKALVDLNGAMFKTYEAVRDKWAILDCFVQPGPIQFKGPSSQLLSYLVKPPNKDELFRQIEVQEKLEAQYAGHP